MTNQYYNVHRLSDSIVLFDLDGCLHDDEWRMPLIKAEGDDRFEEYHSKLDQDKPLEVGKSQLKAHISLGHGIIFITARPNSVRAKTFNHIREHHGSDFDLCLFMRADDEEGVGAVSLKNKMLASITNHLRADQKIVAAYDDRPDIIQMYIDNGISGARVLDRRGLRTVAEHGEFDVPAYERRTSVTVPARTAADILLEASQTFRERNAAYKDNAENVGHVMAALFPEGVQLKTAADHKMYHLFELIIVKLTRFANSGLTHQDSIRDAAVYSAMVENLVDTHNIQFKDIA